jgi:antitoxin MazE
MLTPLRKMGNSSGAIIPKAMLSDIGARQGDSVELSVEAGRLVITPVQTHPRAGWAEASAALAAAGDDGLVWPDFGNDEDANWTW